MNSPQLEICCGDIQSVKAAVEAGADRIELCSALEVGGVTPSAGLITTAVAMRGATRVHVLIRPREGDFVYSPEETEIMIADILTAKKCGAQGVVIGALTPEGHIDIAICSRLMEAAGEMSVTFHRAFDMCADSRRALEEIIALGCDKILTSGLANTAAEGIPALRTLNEAASGRITLIGASGVNPANAPRLLEEAGLHELHASARKRVDSTMIFRNGGVAMGADGADEYSRMVTDPAIVAQLLEIVHNHNR